jgi:hypothetical protein
MTLPLPKTGIEYLVVLEDTDLFRPSKFKVIGDPIWLRYEASPDDMRRIAIDLGGTMLVPSGRYRV